MFVFTSGKYFFACNFLWLTAVDFLYLSGKKKQIRFSTSYRNMNQKSHFSVFYHQMHVHNSSFHRHFILFWCQKLVMHYFCCALGCARSYLFLCYLARRATQGLQQPKSDWQRRPSLKSLNRNYLLTSSLLGKKKKFRPINPIYVFKQTLFKNSFQLGEKAHPFRQY